MENIKLRRFLICAPLFLLASAGEAATLRVNCQTGNALQASVERLKPGDTLLVSGTCNENVTINESIERITIDGQGTAAINAADATRSTVGIRGRNIILTGLTITGGDNGVGLSRAERQR